jgi:23S rRNA (uracil1939-C5)-methyltransferase
MKTLNLRKEAQPACPLAKECGGCQLQDLSYEEQLAYKQRRVDALLDGLCKPEPIVGMSDPWHYRNKVQAAFGYDPRRGIVSGIYRPSSHRIVPVERCLIEDETADAIVGTVRSLMPSFKIMAYDERRGTGFLRHVLVRRGFSTGQIMVVLVGTSPVFPAGKPLAKKLVQLYPQITTVVLNINDRFGPAVLGDREKVLYGSGTIEDTLCGLTFRLSARSFYQINPIQTEILYNLAMDYAALTGTETVLDAYCGVGTIGLIASRHAGQVLGVERNPDAVHDAIYNARRNTVENCRFYTDDAGRFMEELARDGLPVDAVFLDPPRTGSDRQFLSSLLLTRPKKIIYISCNPETLARDLRVLTNGGYSVIRARPVDMFPHTEHVECVVLMSRVKDRKS